jgi:protein-tyrosine phosphatase
MSTRVRICFVCLGNICRSPTAEGIMVHLLAQHALADYFEIESAGTAAYHVGERPDRRTLRTAAARGVDLPSCARAFEAHDFARFDYVIAMDSSNRDALLKLAPTAEDRKKVHLLRSFDRQADASDVPDPYFGGDGGFEYVFDVCESACLGLLAELRARHSL